MNFENLRKFLAPEFVLGSGSRRLAAGYAKNFGLRKILIVTDPGVFAAGWTQDIQNDLKQQKIAFTRFDRVTPNPRIEEVMAGAKVYEENHCDGIIAVGGGSPIDCAKGIGVVATNRKHILEFEGVDEVRNPIPPLICIPTTGGSSADVSQFAILTDLKTRKKVAIISKAIVPDVALLDSETLTTLSPEVTVDTCLDTLVHAFEAYVSNAHYFLTDLLALNAVKLIYRNLSAVLKDPGNLDLLTRITEACLEAGIAFSNAGLGLNHAMAHSLGGFLDESHGRANALLLPYIVSYNYDTVPDRYLELGKAMDLSFENIDPDMSKKLFLSKLRSFLDDLRVLHPLSQIGVDPYDIPELARKAFEDTNIVTNPRIPTLGEIKKIYEQAL